MRLPEVDNPPAGGRPVDGATAMETISFDARVQLKDNGGRESGTVRSPRGLGLNTRRRIWLSSDRSPCLSHFLHDQPPPTLSCLASLVLPPA